MLAVDWSCCWRVQLFLTPIITSHPTGGDFIIRTLQGANVVKVALYDLLELIYLYKANVHIQLCLLAKGFRDLVDLIAFFDECWHGEIPTFFDR